jgi:hypothetical protein
MTKGESRELADFFVDHLGRHKQEMRALIEVSVESLRDEIRIVADGVLINGRRIDEQTRRIDANTTRIDANTASIDANTASIEGLSVRVGRLEDRMGRVEGRLSGLEERVEGVRG